MNDEADSEVWAALRGVIDPELGLSVVDLGLVYGATQEGGRVAVRLTMTTPACPLGEQIVRDATARLHALPGVTEARVELVWEPPWTPARMSPSARELLGWEPE
jgi:metal-sulfur cluster biosynthetic enzyme